MTTDATREAALMKAFVGPHARYTYVEGRRGRLLRVALCSLCEFAYGDLVRHGQVAAFVCLEPGCDKKLCARHAAEHRDGHRVERM